MVVPGTPTPKVGTGVGAGADLDLHANGTGALGSKPDVGGVDHHGAHLRRGAIELLVNFEGPGHVPSSDACVDRAAATSVAA